MNITPWSMCKIALIAAFTAAVAAYQLTSVEDAWGLGVAVAIAFGFVALFQLATWFFYDVATLKRGGWSAPLFRDSPFASLPGPFIHLQLEALALQTFGVAKIVCAVFQDLPSLFLGGWLLVIGTLLLAWQKLLRKVFGPRFARLNGEPDAAGNSRRAGQLTGL